MPEHIRVFQFLLSLYAVFPYGKQEMPFLRRHINLKTCGRGEIADSLERTSFESFVPDAEARPVPEKYLAFVAALIEVDKQMIAERIQTHDVTCEHRELVKPATHIHRLGVYEYSHGRWKRQHRPAWRKTEMTLLKVLLSAEERIRSV